MSIVPRSLPSTTPREKYWDGCDLPFPVLLDDSSSTIEQFGIHAFPTMILVDPVGKLVGMTHGIEELKAGLMSLGEYRAV